MTGYQITQEDIEKARDVREHLLRDPHRPGYHFVVPEGQAHPADPNGAIFWQGNVHLGYIYQRHGKHCWGHVSSHDCCIGNITYLGSRRQQTVPKKVYSAATASMARTKPFSVPRDEKGQTALPRPAIIGWRMYSSHQPILLSQCRMTRVAEPVPKAGPLGIPMGFMAEDGTYYGIFADILLRSSRPETCIPVGLRRRLLGTPLGRSGSA